MGSRPSASFGVPLPFFAGRGARCCDTRPPRSTGDENKGAAGSRSASDRRECERVRTAGFSLPLFSDRNGAASVTAKVNTADRRRWRPQKKAGLSAFLSGRHRRPVKAALPERQLHAREWSVRDKKARENIRKRTDIKKCSFCTFLHTQLPRKISAVSALFGHEK